MKGNELGMKEEGWRFGGGVPGVHKRNMGKVRDSSRVGKEEMAPSSQNTDVTEIVSSLSYCTQYGGVSELRGSVRYSQV